MGVRQGARCYLCTAIRLLLCVSAHLRNGHQSVRASLAAPQIITPHPMRARQATHPTSPPLCVSAHLLDIGVCCGRTPVRPAGSPGHQSVRASLAAPQIITPHPMRARQATHPTSPPLCDSAPLRDIGVYCGRTAVRSAGSYGRALPLPLGQVTVQWQDDQNQPRAPFGVWASDRAPASIAAQQSGFSSVTQRLCVISGFVVGGQLHPGGLSGIIRFPFASFESTVFLFFEREQHNKERWYSHI
jgi:hypothetical protein